MRVKAYVLFASGVPRCGRAGAERGDLPVSAACASDAPARGTAVGRWSPRPPRPPRALRSAGAGMGDRVSCDPRPPRPPRPPLPLPLISSRCVSVLSRERLNLGSGRGNAT